MTIDLLTIADCIIADCIFESFDVVISLVFYDSIIAPTLDRELTGVIGARGMCTADVSNDASHNSETRLFKVSRTPLVISLYENGHKSSTAAKRYRDVLELGAWR